LFANGKNKERMENRNRIIELLTAVRYTTNDIGKVADEICSLFNVSKRFWHFDCWDRTGKLQTITIEALNEENATIIFKAKHEDLGFDPPY
jgi:hypothetical protein